jgi:hypothetical protein
MKWSSSGFLGVLGAKNLGFVLAIGSGQNLLKFG